MNTWKKVVPSLFLTGIFISLSMADKCLLNCEGAAVPGQNLARIVTLGVMILLVVAIFTCKLFMEERNFSKSTQTEIPSPADPSQETYKFLGIGHNFMEWSHLNRSMAAKR